MLINLSNHPSNSWPENQLSLAQKLYGTVIDLPFPQIPPNADSASLDAIVGAFFDRLVHMELTAIHIMGELTFTYRLVCQLKAVGMQCVASTTERISNEADGVKSSVFRFVRFREY